MSMFTSAPLGWTLLFLLGLRHGLDPDHIAVIDGLALGAAERDRGRSRWIGLMFAVGHTLSFTAVAATAGVLGSRLTLSPRVSGVLDWFSILLLAGLGVANLAALRRAGDYRPAGWRAGLLRRLPNGEFAAVAAGLLFGLMFDTAVQAAALGVAAAASGGVVLSVVLSGVFGAGMSVTDGLDGLLLARALRVRGGEGAKTYRRVVGWIVVALSFGMAGVELLSKLDALEAEGAALTVLGASAAVLVIGASSLSGHRRRQRTA